MGAVKVINTACKDINRQLENQKKPQFTQQNKPVEQHHKIQMYFHPTAAL